MTQKLASGISRRLLRVSVLLHTGKDLETYLGDEMLRAAVERKFGIVGEALSQLLRNFPEYRDKISQVADTVAFRNQIVHGYATVRDDLVWEIVQAYLPTLQAEIDRLLKEG